MNENAKTITYICRVCGSSYNTTPNPEYETNKYALKYANKDDKYCYHSNMVHYKCPTCMVTGRK